MAEISVKRFKNYDGNDIFTQDYDPSKRAYITGTPIDTDGHVCNQVFDKKIYLDETAGQLTAETFKGNLKGNADTATKATQDGNGNVITDTYMTNENPTGSGSFSLNRKAGTIIGGNSFAEGIDTTASTYGAHAEGEETTASGYASHAEGIATIASEWAAHAEGAGTIARGVDSHAEGLHTVASGDCQHTQGKYNIEDSENIYAHIVGNGTSNDARSNAHTLDWNGNAWYAGNVTIGTDKKQLVTADHTHSYAGSSSIGGAATSANKVNNKLILDIEANDPGNISSSSIRYEFDGSIEETIRLNFATGNHSHPLANGTETSGLIKTTSTITSNSGYTACPVINGVPYYKDTTNFLPLSGGTLTGVLNGTSISASGSIDANTITSASTLTANGSLHAKSGIEVFGATPYVDFHFGNTSEDNTSRIIEDEAGLLNVNSVTFRKSATGSVGGEKGMHTDYSIYMKRGVFYNSYSKDPDTNALKACCILGISGTTNALCLGTHTYPHDGNTIIKAPKGYISLGVGTDDTGSESAKIMRITEDGIFQVTTGQSCGLEDNPWYRVWTNRLTVKAAKPTFTYLGTTEGTGLSEVGSVVSNATNCYVGTSGILSRTSNTSSRTIKHDIKDLEDESIRAERLYDLPVHQAKYNADILDEDDCRYLKDMPMFIIEEMDEIYPIAVDKCSDNVKEWAWNERYLIPSMLKLIQDQKKEIDTLKDELKIIKESL